MEDPPQTDCANHTMVENMENSPLTQILHNHTSIDQCRRAVNDVLRNATTNPNIDEDVAKVMHCTIWINLYLLNNYNSIDASTIGMYCLLYQKQDLAEQKDH